MWKYSTQMLRFDYLKRSQKLTYEELVTNVYSALPVQNSFQFHCEYVRVTVSFLPSSDRDSVLLILSTQEGLYY